MTLKQPFLGQRFRNLSAQFHNAEWVLTKIFTGVDGREYASLNSAEDHTNHKTLALAIVTDTRRFLLLDAPVRKAN